MRGRGFIRKGCRTLAIGQDTDTLFAVQPVGEGCYLLSGTLTFVNARAALRSLSEVVRDGGGGVLLDLQSVVRVDSAGLALLIEVMRLARQRDVRLRFRNLPAQVGALAAVSGVAAMLPCVEAAQCAPSQS